ncbi:ABC transporter permease [Nocardioides humi]|uniref:ABC transporter permease n=1 Tax=Nocardioides humi TaxID=449461 RepID=A0ABN2BWT3_9ACTN|nr:ABC transporter permease [Nocardioides humi]
MTNSSLVVRRPAEPQPAGRRSDPSATRARRLGAGPHTGIWVATVVLFLVSAVIAPSSLASSSLTAMLPFWAVLAVVSLGQTLVVQQRGIDMSVPGTVTLCAMVLPILSSRHDLPVGVAVFVVLVAGAGIGLVNGLVIIWFRITPLIATLAVNALSLGVMFAITQSIGAAAPAGLQQFANARPAGVPMLALAAVAIVLGTAGVSSHTAFGRRFVAVGANPVAATALGIRPGPYVVGAYVASAVLAAASAVLLVGYVQNPNANIGEPYLFQSITAVVIGGTSLAGGRGSLLATAVAALFLAQLAQVVLSLGAAPSTQLLVQAVALVLALSGSSLLRAWSRRRGREAPAGRRRR